MIRQRNGSPVRIGTLTALGLSLLLTLAACGDDSVDQVANLELQVFPENAITFESIPIGDSRFETIDIRNITDGSAIKITSVTLDADSAFSLECEKGTSGFDLAEGELTFCTVTYAPTEPEVSGGEVRISWNGGGDRVIVIDPPGLFPIIEATPSPVNFVAQRDASDLRVVKVRNVGTAPLEISRFQVVGATDVFTAEAGDDTPSFDEDSPLVLQPFNDDIGPGDPGAENNELQIFVTYTPSSTGTDEGDLRIINNDPARAELDVPLVGNSNDACILLREGTRIDFGESRIGGLNERTITVENCGNDDLVITRIEPGENAAMIDDTGSTDPFIIDLGDRDADNDGNLTTEPMTIEPGASDTFVLGCAPTEETAYSGTAYIHSNDPLESRLPLDMFCRGVVNECPTAVARGTIRGGSTPPDTQVEAAPLQYLIVDGNGSTDFDGEVVDWAWEVIERPDGSVAQLEPVDSEAVTAARRQLFLDLAGRYVIELTAIDDGGATSCETSRVTVLVVPTEAIHVQLVWNNPEDDDQTDFSGSDVDLHFYKMGFGDGYFDAPYDNYFGNREPLWSPELPSLDIDDTNGAGPENINLDNPVECQWYGVAVHYWREQFGTAYTTLRIFIDGQLRFEYLNKPLVRTNDWWDVARIHWPSGEIILVDQFYEAQRQSGRPPITPGMMDSGLCGVPTN